MASITDTTTQNIFRRTDSKDVRFIGIFEFDSDPSRPEITRITLPEKSTFSAGSHWHEQHTEYFKVIQGRISIKHDGVVKVITPDDGPQRVDRFVVHDFCRADKYLPDEEKDTGDVIAEEWTDPEDGIKELFFRNVFSTLQDAEKYWGRWTYMQLLTVLTASDEFIDIVPGRFSYVATHILYSGVQLVAPLMGFRSWREEYTPASLRNSATGTKSSKLD